MGLAYAVFSHEHPALSQIMIDSTRTASVIRPNSTSGPYALLKSALVEQGLEDSENGAALETLSAALWCAAHGLADLSGSDALEPVGRLFADKTGFFKAALMRLVLARKGVEGGESSDGALVFASGHGSSES